MIKASNEASFHGSFTLPGGKSVFGELLLKGPATTLMLKNASAIGSDFERRNLHGMSVDNDHITCIGCVYSGDRHRMQGGVTTFYADPPPAKPKQRDIKRRITPQMSIR